MKRGNFLRYFLIAYFVCIVPVGTAVLRDDILSWKEKTGVLFLVPLGISIILAPIFYWLHPKLHKRHRRKKIKKEFFQIFIKKHHFNILEDGYIVGLIDNYVVLMHANYDDFQQSKWIEVQVIFNPKRKDTFISDAFINRMIRKFSEKEVSWFLNSVIIKKQYALKFPKYEIIYPVLKRCISELKANQIEPISYQEWKSMIQETQKYLDKRVQS